MIKKISSEFAIGFILATTIIIGTIFWLNGKRVVEVYSSGVGNVAYDQKNIKVNVSVVEPKQKPQIECKPRYYEGEAEVSVWLISETDEKVEVEIKNEDIEKLPTTKVDSLNANFIATLIDPTDEVRQDLKNSSEDDPTTLVVHGYAQICQDSPAVSIQQASIAFKKG